MPRNDFKEEAVSPENPTEHSTERPQGHGGLNRLKGFLIALCLPAAAQVPAPVITGSTLNLPSFTYAIGATAYTLPNAVPPYSGTVLVSPGARVRWAIVRVAVQTHGAITLPLIRRMAAKTDCPLRKAVRDDLVPIEFVIQRPLWMPSLTPECRVC